VRPVQRFSSEYLEHARRIRKEEVLEYLDNFRLLHAQGQPSRLISMKVPEPLLAAFRARCRADGVRYQTRIKQLMRSWVDGSDASTRRSGP
jgi:uncharacterized protein (DUF4415 family)